MEFAIQGHLGLVDPFFIFLEFSIGRDCNYLLDLRTIILNYGSTLESLVEVFSFSFLDAPQHMEFQGGFGNTGDQACLPSL